MDVLPRLLVIEQVGVDCLEERRIQCHRLGNHLAVGQQLSADDLDLRERGRGVEDPQRRVREVTAREEPFVGFVDRRQRMQPGA